MSSCLPPTKYSLIEWLGTAMIVHRAAEYASYHTLLGLRLSNFKANA